MATIQVRDLPDEVAETFRDRADRAGQSLQTYMREQMIQWAHRRDKHELLTLVERTLSGDPAPGLSGNTIDSALAELRGE